MLMRTIPRGREVKVQGKGSEWRGGPQEEQELLIVWPEGKTEYESVVQGGWWIW